MSTRSQRFSGTVITLRPVSARLAAAAGSMRLAVTTSDGTVPGAGKDMVARRHAARHLQIDQPVDDAVAADHLAHHDASALRCIGQAIAQFAERTVEPVEMARHVDDEARRHLADLVDAVGELVAASSIWTAAWRAAT